MTSRLSIVIPCYNEGQTIGRLIRRLKRWSRNPDIFVIANGCTDNSVQEVRATAANLMEFSQPLGGDIARAVGLSAATGDICLVVDGDAMVSPEELEPFVQAVDSGVDLALNRNPLPASKTCQHPAAVAKQTVNLFCDREDLYAASLATIPYALSRTAIQRIGWRDFAVPPVAQVKAFLTGLQVQAVALVPTVMGHSVRNRPCNEFAERLMIGDCLEALALIAEQRGERAGFTENHVVRSTLSQISAEVESLQGSSDSTTVRNLAIVSVHEKPRKLQRYIQHIARSGLDGIQLVCYNPTSKHISASRDGKRSLNQERDLGEKVDYQPDFQERRRPVVANRYVLMDGDVVVGQGDLRQFVQAMDRVDLALNDSDDLWLNSRLRNAVSVVRRFLNLVLEREDLGSASMVELPYAIHRKVIESIGADSLAIPPLAQVKAVLGGFRVAAVHGVNAGARHRIRRHVKNLRHGKALTRLVLGDHLQALAYLQEKRGVRGPFPDEVRRRDWLNVWKPTR